MSEETKEDFKTWLQVGMDNGWCTPPTCATHDGIPPTVEGRDMWARGEDPCEHVLRLWPEGQTATKPSETASSDQ